VIGFAAVAVSPKPRKMTPDPPERPKAALSDTVRDTAPYVGLGSSLAGSLLVCIWGGRWLDRRLGTDPAFTLVGAGVGLLAAFYHFYRMYLTFTRKDR
jgi:ATP synthase protein I